MVALVATRSTCARGQNGAIVHDASGRVLMSGYNGALSGQEHCEHPCSCGHPVTGGRDTWHLDGCTFKRPCKASVHAEANAILWCARRGQGVEGMSMVCTTAPCYQCAQMIAQSGITRVEYLKPYRLMEGIELLLASNVNVVGPLMMEGV